MTHKLTSPDDVSDIVPGTKIKVSKVKNDLEVIGVVEIIDKTAASGRPYISLKGGVGWFFTEGQDVVTVLENPAPEEPTAFGALVRSNGVRYVRTFNGPVPPARLTTVYPWAPEKSRDTPISRNQTWAELKLSNLEVLNDDPFARTSPDKTTDDDSPR